MKMKEIYLIIRIASIPDAFLRDWLLVEDWASIRTTKPLHPLRDLEF
jgi:hypothetical protein